MTVTVNRLLNMMSVSALPARTLAVSSGPVVYTFSLTGSLACQVLSVLVNGFVYFVNVDVTTIVINVRRDVRQATVRLDIKAVVKAHASIIVLPG